MDNIPPVAATTSVATEDKTTAIVSYLTLIGFIAAVIIHGNKKTKLGSFHLRQSLGLILTSIAVGMVWIIPILGWIVGFVGWIALLVFWVIGLIAAINGQQKPVPLLGEHYQKWFGTAFE
jgi:uncharacterized membrane protein